MTNPRPNLVTNQLPTQQYIRRTQHDFANKVPNALLVSVLMLYRIDRLVPKKTTDLQPTSRQASEQHDKPRTIHTLTHTQPNGLT